MSEVVYLNATFPERSEKEYLKRFDRAGSRGKWLAPVAAAVLILLGVALYAGGRWLETRDAQAVRGDLTQTETVETREVGGVTYRRRENLTSILVMGVDHDSEVESEGSYEGGQADFQRVVVIDPENKTIRQLKIDRDTMAECTVLGYFGSPVGTKEMQISLAHGFGDGKEESCEYARQAAEGLLLDESIDFYLAMNLDGISTLNDLAGGVTVTLEDDFSEIDPAMTKGATLTLQGDQAETFVRSRMTVGDGTNESRMKRQEEFLSQLAAQLGQKVRASEQFTADLYDELQPYLVTDMARGRIINEVWNARDYTLEPTLELTGEHKTADDGFTEFYPDAGSVEQAVLELFWEPVE